MRKLPLLLHFMVLLLLPLLGPIAFSQQDFWTQSNGPYSGVIEAITIDSLGQLWISVSDRGGGVFKSTDGGWIWDRTTALPPDPHTAFVYPIAFAVDHDNAIFAGTAGYGLYRSTDDGLSWVQLNFGTWFPNISAISVNSQNNLFANLDGSGVYRSTNGGNSWFLRGSPTPVSVLEITSDGTIYAGGTVWDGFEPPTAIVKRSSDDGISFEILLSLDGYRLYDLVVREEILVVATSNGTYSSTDGGETWSGPATPPGEIVDLTMDRSNILLAATSNGVFQSSNLGTSWTELSDFESPLVVRSIGDRRLFVGLDFQGGVYQSTNGGDTWLRTGIRNSSCWALGVDGEGDIISSIYGGYTGGIYRSDDQGDSWIESSTGMDDDWVTCIALSSDGSLYAGTAGYLYRSTDDGLTWQQYDFPPFDVHCIATNEQGHVFVGTVDQKIYRSTNQGETWKAVIEFPDYWRPHGILVAPGNLIYAAVQGGGGVFISSDNGDSWTRSIDGLVDTTVQTIARDADGYIYAGTWQHGVFRSSDSGKSWVQSGLADNDVWRFAIDSLGNIFAATTGNGVFRSTDSGQSWAEINSGLGTLDIRDLRFDRYGYLYAGTSGDGVFRSLNLITTVRDQESSTIPNKMSLLQNYPNPFNAISNFEFGIVKSGEVSLKVYDLLGREVATIVNEKLGAGTYTRQWDAAGLASGVYVYRLNVGEFVESRKLVLIR